MKVVDLLDVKGRSVATVREWTTVEDAIALLAEPPQIGAVVVLRDDRRVVGLFSEPDIVRGLHEHGPSVLTLPVSELMSRNVPTCRPDDRLEDVMRTITRFRFRQLPVVEEGRLTGLISIGDMVRARLAEMRLEAAVLRDVVIART
jgi:CBS domain-containing protein